jgi:hypothetical protein
MLDFVFADHFSAWCPACSDDLAALPFLSHPPAWCPDHLFSCGCSVLPADQSARWPGPRNFLVHECALLVPDIPPSTL